MAAVPGQMYQRLAEAVARAGSPRSVYSQDTTLSRRGLLTRADRRARELTSLGIGARDVVALSMGNVVEFLVLLLATNKIGAVALPVDPANGDRMLKEACQRLPVRAVVRRPRGMDSAAVDYGEPYAVQSRRRLTGSLLTADVLEPPDHLQVALPGDAELLMEARGRGGIVRDTVRGGGQLRAIGEAAVSTLGLDPGTRLLCAQPFTVPRFFDAVVLGWLASEAQLIMAEGPALQSVLPIARGYENLVVVDAIRELLELARSVKSAGTTLPLTPVIPEAMVPLAAAKPMRQAFGQPPQQLLLLEEIGVLAVRVMERGAAFAPAAGVEVSPGADMAAGGREVLVRGAQVSVTIPAIPAGEPGGVAEDGWHHTGYAGRFTRGEALQEIVGRDDGLVNLEGRRACLDSIEELMLEHRRLTWVRATQGFSPTGEPHVELEYKATGETEVDDIEEHAIGSMPPFMVPRTFVRLEGE